MKSLIISLMIFIATACNTRPSGVLEEGDCLLVSVDAVVEQCSSEVVVSNEGFHLPYLKERVKACGMTLAQAEKTIADMYAEAGIYRAPSVSLDLLEPVKVELLGRVLNPGRYMVSGWRELARLISRESLGGNGKVLVVNGKRKMSVRLMDMHRQCGQLPVINGVVVE